MAQESVVAPYVDSGGILTIRRIDGDSKLPNSAYPQKQADMFKFDLQFHGPVIGDLIVEAFTPAPFNLNGEETLERTLGHNWMPKHGDEFSVLAGRGSSYAPEHMDMMGEFRFTKEMDTTPAITLPQIEHEVVFRVTLACDVTGHRQYHAMSDVFKLQLEQEVPDGMPNGPGGNN